MKHIVRMTPEVRMAFSQHSRWFTAWGLLLVLLGILAISYSALTTLISIMILGAVITAGGAVVILDSFIFWWKKGSGFYLHLLMGILYLIAGCMLISSPVIASVSITLILGIFYLFLGMFRLFYSCFYELPGFWLRMLNGIITLLLGFLILSSWPASGLFVIGLFIGIDILFLGLVYLFSASIAR